MTTDVRPRVAWLSLPFSRRHGGGPLPPPAGAALAVEGDDTLLLSTEDVPPLALAPEAVP